MGFCGMTKEKILENLLDAGCSEATIAGYFEAMEAGNKKAALAHLEKHREKLLEQFHKSSSCIDCLDYFVTKAEKHEREKQDENI